MIKCVRIFKLVDESAEEDEGTVTLARVREKADGSVKESVTCAGKWASGGMNR